LLNGYFADLMFVVAAAVCWRFRKGWGRPVLFGLAFYAVTLFPALGLFNSQFLTKWRVSDHLQYLPIMAPIALAAGGLAAALPKIIFKGLGVAIILTLALLTTYRAAVFASEENLFHDTLAKNPAAWGAHNDWGVILASRGNYEEAEKEFREALKCKPDYADAESNLGEVLLTEGKTGEAGSLFAAALSTKPENAATQLRYAGFLSKLGQTPQAAYHQRMAIEFSPRPETKTRLDYANMLHRLGDFGGAEEQFRKALSVDPNSVEALNNLAWMLATAPEAKFRNGAEAVKLAERAEQFPSPKGMCVPGTLAAAYAEAGRYLEAVSTAQKAVEDEMDHDQMQFARINSQLLNYYQDKKPFHESPPNPNQ
jgi:Flp pilus assembly protein TadD